MKKHKIIFLFGIFFHVIFSGQAFATDRYMALTGSNVGDCSVEASPCLTLQYAMTKMSGGDTLYIEDGNYTSANNSITSHNFPPSGNPMAFTVIRAKNIPCQGSVQCNQPLKVRFSGNAIFNINHYPHANSNETSEYVKFWGIRWDGIRTYTGWNNYYFKQVASQGVLDGNTATITIGGQYNLLEDVVAFGKGRYKFLFYDYTTSSQTNGPGNNLCRRCVVRHDWAMKNDVSPNPIAGIASYWNRGTACLNCIVIDSDTPSEWMEVPTELAGAFYQPNDSGAHAMIIKGSLVINTAMGIFMTSSGSTGHVITDLVAVHVAGGIVPLGSIDMDRLTFVDVDGDNFTYRSETQKNKVYWLDDGIRTWSGVPSTLHYSIFRDIADDGVDGSNIANDYINMFNIGGANYVGSTQAANFYTTDPFLNGLEYPPRVETGSVLASQAVGARIINKLGIDGTFKNEGNWDTEQGSLWPWPLEAWIRAEMKTSEYTTDPNRGFCASGQTLTKYIWEYLGSSCPNEICNYKIPSPPQNLRSMIN